jgi:hypothetical protein
MGRLPEAESDDPSEVFAKASVRFVLFESMEKGGLQMWLAASAQAVIAT